jgi:hypothetical protein
MVRQYSAADGRGEGCLAQHWAVVATAISGSPVHDDDIVLVRKHAAAFIIEALKSIAQSIVSTMKGSRSIARGSVVPGRRKAHRQTPALRVIPLHYAAQGRDWTRHIRMCAHLASHAHKASVIGELASDGMFIAEAEPLRTLRRSFRSRGFVARRACAYCGLRQAMRSARECSPVLS